jgi:hypothetical protein
MYDRLDGMFSLAMRHGLPREQFIAAAAGKS